MTNVAVDPERAAASAKPRRSTLSAAEKGRLAQKLGLSEYKRLPW